MNNRIHLEAVHGQLCNALELERCSHRNYAAALPFARHAAGARGESHRARVVAHG